MKPIKWTIIQSVAPHYRVNLFDNLYHSLIGSGSEFYLYSGDVNAYGMFRDAAHNKPWRIAVSNSYFLNRRVLWQGIPVMAILSSEVVIAELNPRILSNWIIAILRSLLRKPMIFWGQAWSRSGRRSWSNIVRVLMWRLCDARIAYTVTEVDELASIALHSTAARNTVYSINHKRSCRSVSREPFEFITVSRLSRDKKVDLAIRAVDLLRKKGVPVILHVVGEGPEFENLKTLVLELGLSTLVNLHGFIDLEDMRLGQLMSRSLAAISPGFVGLSAIQTFYHGLPFLVAREEPHCPEIEACREGFNTFYFKSNAPAALADRIKDTIANADILIDRADLIEKEVKGSYSIEVMAKTFLDAGKKLLTHGPVI